MNGSGIMEAAILDYYVFTGEHSRKKKGFVLMITYRYYSLVFGQKQLRIFQLHYFTSPLDAVKIQHTFFITVYTNIAFSANNGFVLFS